MIAKYKYKFNQYLPIFFLKKQQYQIMNTIDIEINIIMAITHIMTIDSWSLSNFNPKTSVVHSSPPELSWKMFKKNLRVKNYRINVVLNNMFFNYI